MRSQKWYEAVSKPRPQHVKDAISLAQRGRKHTEGEGFQKGHKSYAGTERTRFQKGHVPWAKGKPSTNLKHGMAGTSFYSRWRAMNQRCNNPNAKQFKDYGGRGIKIEWASFEDFMSDMYEGFKGASATHGERNIQIERINNDGNYSKENCRWATRKEQMRNRRSNNMLTINGETKCMSDWAETIGISYTALWKRLKKMSPEKAVGHEV